MDGAPTNPTGPFPTINTNVTNSTPTATTATTANNARLLQLLGNRETSNLSQLTTPTNAQTSSLSGVPTPTYTSTALFGTTDRISTLSTFGHTRPNPPLSNTNRNLNTLATLSNLNNLSSNPIQSTITTTNMSMSMNGNNISSIEQHPTTTNNTNTNISSTTTILMKTMNHNTGITTQGKDLINTTQLNQPLMINTNTINTISNDNNSNKRSSISSVTTMKNDKQEITASLALQMSLFFHCRLSLVWIMVWLSELLLFKKKNSQNVQSPGEPSSWSWIDWAVQSTTLAVWMPIEVWRIYLGMKGNLSEKVPHLTGFFFLTVFPQFIIVWFILLIATHSALHFTFLILHVFALVFQLVASFYALRKAIQVQSLRFQIHRETLMKKHT